MFFKISQEVSWNETEVTSERETFSSKCKHVRYNVKILNDVGLCLYPSTGLCFLNNNGDH